MVNLGTKKSVSIVEEDEDKTHLLTLSSFFMALRHTHSSSSSRNSDFKGSLQIGHEIGFASSPGGTTTNIALSSASRFAASSAATTLELTVRPSARPLPFTSMPLQLIQSWETSQESALYVEPKDVPLNR